RLMRMDTGRRRSSGISRCREASVAKLLRGDNAHDLALRVENCHGRDGIVTRRKPNGVRASIHRSCPLSRKRAAKAPIRLPQPAQREVEGAAVAKPRMAFMPFRRLSRPIGYSR